MRSTFIQNVIIYLIFYASTSAAMKLNPSEDVVSLVAFKSVADTGNNLGYSVHNSSVVCKWQGVQCHINGKVVRLVLEDLSLAGVFAANTLTRMEQLRVLSLRNNSLTGPIPDLAALVNLKALFLDHNYFTGAVPSSISLLHRLRILDLSHNKLSGVIPVELSNLDRLNYLRLDSNRLNGSVPPLNQSSLQIFNVSDNTLTGPIPVTPTLARFRPALFSINPRLCGKIVLIECGIAGPFFGKNSSTETMEGFTNSNSIKHRRLGLTIGFSAGFLVLITLILCIIVSIKTSKRRKGIVPTRAIVEAAANAAAEELEKIRRLHQMEKSGKSQLYTIVLASES